MRRTLALVAATAAVGGAAALAAAAPSTLSLTTQTTSHKGTSSAIEDVFRGGKKVGTDRVVCKQVTESKASCKVTLILAKGSILATFAPSGNGGSIKVVGGTGAYKGATGTGAYRSLNQDGSRTAVTLRLS
jgi:hypothetical protein